MQDLQSVHPKIILNGSHLELHDAWDVSLHTPSSEIALIKCPTVSNDRYIISFDRPCVRWSNQFESIINNWSITCRKSTIFIKSFKSHNLRASKIRIFVSEFNKSGAIQDWNRARLMNLNCFNMCLDGFGYFNGFVRYALQVLIPLPQGNRSSVGKSAFIESPLLFNMGLSIAI